MRTEDARRMPVASTQKLIERGAITISSAAAPLFGSTAEKAPDLKNENPAIRAARTIKAIAVRFAALVVSLDRSLPRSLASGVVSLIAYS